jgi:cytochrome c oxidase subunit 1
MFLIGGAMAMVIRAELFQPGMQIVSPEFYNQMITNAWIDHGIWRSHACFCWLANWLVPMQIGAPDMALPRMNNLSFWILPFAFLVLLAIFVYGGRSAKLWLDFLCALSTTEYAPPTVTYFIFAVHIMGASSIMGSINVSSNNYEHESAWNYV